ncbi:MAG: type-F conjugative transfer system secretin TraK [Candidatus Competibacteraceae bacterium]
MNRIRSELAWTGLLLAGWLAVLAAAPAQAEAPSPPTRESVCNGDLSATTLKMRPGINQLIPVALGHLNRLITPFDQPRVTTVDDKSTTQVNGRVVYVATSTETPVSLFISPEGSEEVALSLALVPCRIAPRELTLTLEGTPLAGVKPVEKGGQAPSNYPYVDSLVDVFRELAQNRVPAGYNLRAIAKTDPAMECLLDGISLQPGQVVEGQPFIILIGVARNASGGPVELNEAACMQPTVAAVAAWPQVALAAGETTELYIAYRREAVATTQGASRPSLLRK